MTEERVRRRLAVYNALVNDAEEEVKEYCKILGENSPGSYPTFEYNEIHWGWEEYFRGCSESYSLTVPLSILWRGGKVVAQEILNEKIRKAEEEKIRKTAEDKEKRRLAKIESEKREREMYLSLKEKYRDLA